jgi:predicted ester cyclase
MIAGWAAYFRMFPDYAIQIETILGQGDLVAAFGSASGTYAGKRGLVPENRIEMPAAWRAVVQSGKVSRWQVYADWTDGHRRIAEDDAVG